jgi:hypothetical protein
MASWAAVVAMIAALGGAIQFVANQKERAEAEAARQQVAVALQIVGSKLQVVQTRLSRMHDLPERNSNQ